MLLNKDDRAAAEAQRSTLRTIDVDSGETRDVADIAGRAYSYMFDPNDSMVALSRKASTGEFDLSVITLATGQRRILARERCGILWLLGWNKQADGVYYAIESDRRIDVYEGKLGETRRLMAALERGGTDSISGIPCVTGEGGIIYVTTSGKMVLMSANSPKRTLDLGRSDVTIHGISISHSGRYAAIGHYAESNTSGVLFVDLAKWRVADVPVACTARMLPCLEFCSWQPGRDRALCLFKSEDAADLREYDVTRLF